MGWPLRHHMATYLMRPAGTALVTGLQEFIDTLPPGCFMAEIGSYAGESTRLFLAKAAHIVCVDRWENYREGPISITEMDRVEAVFDTLLLDVPDRVTKVKGASIEVAKTFPADTFDLVYIDADHAYQSTVDDILAWAPKVKTGGLLAGHDYDRDPVRNAVQGIFGRPDGIFPDSTWVVRARPVLPFAHATPS